MEDLKHIFITYTQNNVLRCMEFSSSFLNYLKNSFKYKYNLVAAASELNMLTNSNNDDCQIIYEFKRDVNQQQALHRANRIQFLRESLNLYAKSPEKVVVANNVYDTLEELRNEDDDIQIVEELKKIQISSGSEGISTKSGNDIPLIDLADDSEHYDALLELYHSALARNTDTFDCPVCFNDIQPGQGIILQDCLHSFCEECLENAVKFSETAMVKCPFVNDEYSCNSHLLEREIKALVSAEILERHLQRSLALAEHSSGNSFHCKTPDCKGWCLFEDDVNHFVCPVCTNTNCITCAAIHEGKNCRQYQEEVEDLSNQCEEAQKTRKYLKDMLDKGKAMRCPKCSVVVTKKSGCDWMCCTMCKTELCWVTKGPRWGPKGPGDVSGGCKCTPNKRCHPMCRNCH